MSLTQGQRITLLRIDELMAMTHRYQFEVRQALEPSQVGYQRTDRRVAVVRQKGKRKDHFLDLRPDCIVLDGWDVPFVADTEVGNVWAGNACYNLVGDPVAIRQCLETRAVYPIRDEAKGKIIVYRQPRANCTDDDAILLYAELGIHHAVIDRMKAEKRMHRLPIGQ